MSIVNLPAGASFVREHLKGMRPYTPIEPFEVLSARLGRDPADIVKLDANENPYGPPPAVAEALGAMTFPHIYPDPETRRLRGLLAEYVGVPAEHILVGCGADELIDLIMRVCLDPGDAVLDCPPTFTMYAFDAEVNAARVVTVPRRADLSLDVPAVEAAMAAPEGRPKIIFATSPNNPDGGVVSDADLERLLALGALVVLDEAYIEFCDAPSRSAWVREHPNLIVLRTFSKMAGLAGLRVGYGIFPLDLAEYMWRAKQPYNVSVAAETAACAALENMGYLEDVKQALLRERGRLTAQLEGVPFFEAFPSQANFVFCKVVGGYDAAKVKADLAAQGIMVRHYDKELLRGYVRISVGKPEQTDALMAALHSLQP